MRFGGWRVAAAGVSALALSWCVALADEAKLILPPVPDTPPASVVVLQATATETGASEEPGQRRRTPQCAGSPSSPASDPEKSASPSDVTASIDAERGVGSHPDGAAVAEPVQPANGRD